MTGLKATLLLLLQVLGLALTAVHRQEKSTATLALSPRECQQSGKRGACLPYFYCGTYSGTSRGTCSLGLGECCVFDKSCGQSSAARLTYLTSQSDDATDTGTCSLSLTKADDICQLRLDMKELELSEPNAEGECVQQYLHVQGVSGGSLKICGTNTAQHLYVDVRGDNGPFKVAVVNTDNNPLSSWNVEVEQIHCDSPDLAPIGCDQYYSGLSGQVKSFNYNTQPSTETQPAGDPGTRHLQESYTMCVRQEPGYCSLRWTAAPAEDYAFTLTGNLIPNRNNSISLFNFAGDGLCPFTDHLVIAGGRISSEDNLSTVFCGSRFPDFVTTSSFQITMVANGEEAKDNDLDNRGFHLHYQQIEC